LNRKLFTGKGIIDMNNDTKREAVLIFLLLAFMYAYFYHDPSWNGNSRLGLTFAIVQEGRLTIDSFHNREGTITKDKAIYNGHYYTSKAIGTSVLAAFFYLPLYWLEQLLNFKLDLGETKYLLTFLSIGLPSAIAGSLMYVLCKQVTRNRFRAYTAAIVINLGTMIFPYSVILYGHQLAGALLFCAFFLIFHLKTHPDIRRKDILFLIGFLLAFALITEYPVAPIVLILAAYYFFVLWKKDGVNGSLAVLMPALGAVIPIVMVLAYNTAVFDHPISTGYTHSADPWFQEQQTQNLVGIGWPNLKVIFYLTLHPAFGLFWQSPVLLMSLVGIWFMSRIPTFKIEALIAITVFLYLVILYSGFYNWYGGWTFGPRYLIPMLTFMCLPLVFVPERLFSSVVILGLVSIIQMFIVVCSLIVVPDNFYKQIDKLGYFEYSSIYSYCFKLLLDGEFSTNIGNKLLGLNTWVSLVPVISVIMIITLLFFVRWDNNKSIPFLKKQESV
jgi:hypothetical protein